MNIKIIKVVKDMSNQMVGPKVSELYELFGKEEIYDVLKFVLKILKQENISNEIEEIKNRLVAILNDDNNKILCIDVNKILKILSKRNLNKKERIIKETIDEIKEIKTEYFLFKIKKDIDEISNYEELNFFYNNNKLEIFKLNNLEILELLVFEFIRYSNILSSNTDDIKRIIGFKNILRNLMNKIYLLDNENKNINTIDELLINYSEKEEEYTIEGIKKINNYDEFKKYFIFKNAPFNKIHLLISIVEEYDKYKDNIEKDKSQVLFEILGKAFTGIKRIDKMNTINDKVINIYKKINFKKNIF